MFFAVTRLSQAMSVEKKKDSGKSHTLSTNLLYHRSNDTSCSILLLDIPEVGDVVQNLSTCGPTRGLVFVIKSLRVCCEPWDSSSLQHNTVLGSRINIINGIKKCRDSHILCLSTSRILVCWVKLLVRTTILTSCFGHGAYFLLSQYWLSYASSTQWDRKVVQRSWSFTRGNPPLLSHACLRL